MAQLRCKEVGAGLRAAEATVTIEEHDGTPQHLPVDRGMVSAGRGGHYLSVRLIRVDEEHGAALVALPVEADSGANRIWARLGDLMLGAGAFEP